VTTDTALAQLQTQMGFTLANYIRSISGTAASDVEVQRLMGNMASIGNVDELNTALVEQARNNADASLKSMVDTRMY
jgi:c-di-AMP phosphodiesterase-like protein